ncbi:MAG TPA: DUF5801 repeats-in-toxin domain-containing protein, partial [Allosphingosinicella sp.]|nr:DUF5801 repeats-in-toxin domain-containing protein [Allosphingosinicella sp.]
DPDLIRLDDDVIPAANGNLDGPGDDNPDAVPGNVVNGQLNGTGGDAPLTYNFTGVNTLPTGFSIGLASDANTLLIVQDQGGSDVTVMTIELDQSDGSFTVTQDAPILHDPTNPGAGAGQEDNFEDNLLFSIGVEVEDNDGDVEPATITINVDDDTPTINVTQNNESGVVLTTQDAETDGNPTAEDTAVSAINFGGVFGLTQSAGADGAAAPATLAFDLNVVAQNSGLTSQGSVINLFEVGGVIYGTTAGVAPVDGTTPGVVFSLQVSNTGVVTLTQYQQVDHAVEGVTTSPFDDQFATLVNGKITLTASSSLTDNDGDTVTDQEVVDLGGNIRFADDGPDAVNDSADQLTENSSVTVNVFANDAPGADGVNVVGGIAVVPGSLTGAGGLVYNNDGTFTYTPAAGEEGSITFQYQLTDFDGDTDIATVTINLLPDSLPVAADGVAKVDDDGLPAGIGDNASGDLDANSGEAAVVNPSEAIWHGQLVAAGGGDTIVDYDFSSMHGTSGSVGTETVDYTWDNGSSTLTATISGGARDGLELFNVVVNQSTGSYNLTLVRNVQHADEVANQENDATTNLTFTVTDSDGSTDTGLVTVTFDDDMPVVTDVTDPLEIPNSGATPSGTGNFAFDIGADQNADFDDISVSNFTILINGEAATNVVLTPDVDGNGDPAPETATTASYRFTFQYDTGEGGLTNGVGTLVFNKATGEYTVTLTSGPIEGFTILQTGSETTTFVEYDLNGGAPDVVTAQLADSLFAQFTAVSTNNNGTPNLLTTGGNNIAWNPGELFTADPGNPQVSSTDAGVDGNTMDTGEVLDFDLFTSDPGSNTALTPDGSATEMFIQFFQFTADDDIIVILKLQDADNPAITTTRAILIDGDDVFLDGDTATGTSYEGLVAGLGSQDALVVIQSNDYNAVGENWVIVGAQIVTDNDGTTGTGIDLDGDLGPGGASDRDGDGDFGTDSGNAALDELDTFADDTDVSGLKITSIGFLVPSTEAQSATIEFDVTIEDSDGDQVVTQDITVQIGDPPALTLAAESSFSTQTLSKMAANDDYSSSLYAASDGQKYGGNGFGNIGNTGITSAMVAASGFAAMSMTSLNSFSQPSFDAMVQDGLQQLSAQVTGREMMGGEDFGSLSLASQLDGSAVNAVNLSNSGISFEDHGFVGGGLDAMSFGDAGPAYVPNYAAGQPVMASIPAFAANVPTVSMASAEMLKAASLEGHVQQGGGVEQVLADALGNDAPTIDGVLANLPGGIAGLSAIANLASPDGAGVPAWDMGMHGGFAPAHDMLMKVAAVEIHQDAVQPA